MNAGPGNAGADASASSAGPARQPFVSVLFVCTGNICRSPVAERLTARGLAGLGVDVHVASAGTRAVVGSGIHPASAAALAELGGEPDGFAARRLLPGMVLDAHLTLTMTRQHRQEVLGRSPRALARTFTLREAAQLMQYVSDGSFDGATPTERAAELVSRLAAARARRAGGPDDDVRDPMGAAEEVHREVAVEIAHALVPIVARLRSALVVPGPQRMPTLSGVPGVGGAGVADLLVGR